VHGLGPAPGSFREGEPPGGEGRGRCSLGLLGRLEDEGLVDVGDDTTASDGGLDQGVELLVSTDSELQVSRGDSLHLQVLAGVAGELQDLSGQVLEDGSRVDCGGSSNSAVGANSALQESVNSSNWEL
jgi:hypothetical protein